MQEAFGYVLFVVVGLGILAALLSFIGRGKLYDDIGKGGLFVDEDAPRGGMSGGASIDIGERDDEIRQMLTARNARRAAAGRETVDIEAELARLTAPAVDDSLRAEIRELVVARNNRRIARGREPLDVDAEVERQIAELGDLG